MEYKPIEISAKEIFKDSLKISLPLILILVSVLNLIHYKSISMTLLHSFILMWFTVKLTVNVINAKDFFNKEIK